MAQITIGCRLPSGLILELMKDGRPVAVELAGQRQMQERSPIILLRDDDYGTTEVDAAFWDAWKKIVGDDFAPLKSGAIFEAKNSNDAASKAKELKGKQTGHEPAKQDDGVKKADS